MVRDCLCITHACFIQHHRLEAHRQSDHHRLKVCRKINSKQAFVGLIGLVVIVILCYLLNVHFLDAVTLMVFHYVFSIEKEAKRMYNRLKRFVRIKLQRRANTNAVNDG